MLKGFDAVTGRLDPGVRELLAGRAYSPAPHRRALPPYSETEWERLTTTCRMIVDESYAAHRRALAAAERRHAPRVDDWSTGNLAWLLARLGPVGTPGVAAHLGCSLNAAQKRGGVPDASAGLFPHLSVVIAYRLLFGVYSGIVPDGIDDLVVDAIDWAGDATILLSYVKGRTAAESLTLPRKAVRLLEQWLAHSALRSHARSEAARQLWLGVLPDHSLDDHPPLDVLLVPGGVGARRGASNTMTGWIRKAAADASWVTSVCTGAFLLHEAGLARGRRVATHHAFEDTSPPAATSPSSGMPATSSPATSSPAKAPPPGSTWPCR